MKILITEILN